MSITEIIAFLKSLGITPVYPLAFPASSPDRAYMLEVGQGFSSRGSLADVVLTITVKAEHPSEAERMSIELKEKLDKMTDVVIGDNQVVLIKAQQLLPNYLGMSADGFHFYMNNFRVLVND